MRFLIVLFVLSVTVITVIVLQAARQEIKIRNLKKRTEDNLGEVRRREANIVVIKSKIETLKNLNADLSLKIAELKVKKEESQKAHEGLAMSLGDCLKEKELFEEKLGNITQKMMTLNEKHDNEKVLAEQEIQGLKKQIFDRDQIVCRYVDKSKLEARQLCGLA
ncbi:uncharacterized protein ACB058_019719 [Synchiropus picturatus]